MKVVYITSLFLNLITMFGCNNGEIITGGSGLLEADETLISAETVGTIVSNFINEGDLIKAGDTLAIVEPENIQLELVAASAAIDVLLKQKETAILQVEKSETALNFAKNERDRVTKLYSSSSATQKQSDQAIQNFDQADIASRMVKSQVEILTAEITRARAGIARLEKRLSDCYILAPSDGTVIDKLVELGEFVTPGKPIIKLARLDNLWVNLYLPTAIYAQVKLGDQVNVSTESGGDNYPGEVVWISPEAEFTPKNIQTEQSRADLVYAVKIRIVNNDHKLKIGMPVFITLD